LFEPVFSHTDHGELREEEEPKPILANPVILEKLWCGDERAR